MSARHERYNETLEFIERLENKGQVFIIRPPQKFAIGRVEINPAKLDLAYKLGYQVAKNLSDSLFQFLEIDQKRSGEQKPQNSINRKT